MKKYIYIFAWIILGILLSFIAHAVIEIAYINYFFAKGIILVNHTAFGYGFCVLSIYLQASLLILGMLGGLFAGQYFWKVIYIEKRYRFWRRK